MLHHNRPFDDRLWKASACDNLWHGQTVLTWYKFPSIYTSPTSAAAANVVMHWKFAAVMRRNWISSQIDESTTVQGFHLPVSTLPACVDTLTYGCGECKPYYVCRHTDIWL